MGVVMPDLNISIPVQAIIAPLSMQYLDTCHSVARGQFTDDETWLVGNDCLEGGGVRTCHPSRTLGHLAAPPSASSSLGDVHCLVWLETTHVRELVPVPGANERKRERIWGEETGIHPTPPTMSTSDWPQWAIARSVISTSMANTFSVLCCVCFVPGHHPDREFVVVR
jgi:hypothetical protein